MKAGILRGVVIVGKAGYQRGRKKNPLNEVGKNFKNWKESREGEGSVSQKDPKTTFLIQESMR